MDAVDEASEVDGTISGPGEIVAHDDGGWLGDVIFLDDLRDRRGGAVAALEVELGDEVEIDAIGPGLDERELVFLAADGEIFFELRVGRVVVLNLAVGLLVDDDVDIGDTGGGTLLDDVVDGGAVADGQHGLLDGFGDGEPAGTPASRGDDGFCNLHVALIIAYLGAVPKPG